MMTKLKGIFSGTPDYPEVEPSVKFESTTEYVVEGNEYEDELDIDEEVVEPMTELEMIKEDARLKQEWVNYLSELDSILKALGEDFPEIRWDHYSTYSHEERGTGPLSGPAIILIAERVRAEYDRLIELGYQGWLEENGK